VTIYGAILFGEPDVAEQARDLLEGEGYGVELQDQEDGSIVLVATPSANVSSTEALEAKMRAVASQFSGEFLGHGGAAQYLLGGDS
jgi:hypothetical protein